MKPKSRNYLKEFDSLVEKLIDYKESRTEEYTLCSCTGRKMHSKVKKDYPLDSYKYDRLQRQAINLASKIKKYTDSVDINSENKGNIQKLQGIYGEIREGFRKYTQTKARKERSLGELTRIGKEEREFLENIRPNFDAIEMNTYQAYEQIFGHRHESDPRDYDESRRFFRRQQTYHSQH